MKKVILVLLMAISFSSSFAQFEKKNNEDLIGQTANPVPYRLFPTQNIWTFIKLDTRNGQMWQVQFSMQSEGRFVTFLNSDPLVTKEKEVKDRFTLYPTQNIYTFILLDQLEGKIWQVQWSTDIKTRAVIPIE
jgi:hypothetical protein